MEAGSGLSCSCCEIMEFRIFRVENERKEKHHHSVLQESRFHESSYNTMAYSLKKMRGSVQLAGFQRCLFTAQELSIPMSRKSSSEVRMPGWINKELLTTVKY